MLQANAAKEREREVCDREKEQLAKQFEHRVAGLRLEKEQARLDKALMRRLEKELGELKSLSSSVLGPLAQHGGHIAAHAQHTWEVRRAARHAHGLMRS